MTAPWRSWSSELRLPTSDPAAGRIALGIDAGGTNIRAVAVDLDRSEILRRWTAPMPRDGHGGVAAIRQLITEALADYPDALGVGVGVAGHFGRFGAMLQSAHLPAMVGLDLPVLLSVDDRVPAVDNDATMVAVAAARHTYPEAELVVSVTLGTGIGGGIVLDGVPVRGATGMAGEPGHMIVERGGRRCACGQLGCWEEYASGSALHRAVRELATSRKLVGSDTDRGARLNAVFHGWVHAGDPDALDVLARYGMEVAVGMTGIVQLLDPDVICIGGGVAALGPPLLSAVSDALGNTLAGASNRRLTLGLAPFGEDAGLIGAACASVEY